MEKKNGINHNMNILCARTQAQRVLLPALGTEIPPSTEQPPYPPLSPTALLHCISRLEAAPSCPSLFCLDGGWSEEAKKTLSSVHRAKIPRQPLLQAPLQPSWHCLHAARKKLTQLFPFCSGFGILKEMKP